jgi:mercuric reductase
MSTDSIVKINNAIDRLNKILPLTQRLQSLEPELAAVYRNILSSYVDIGRSLNKSEIALQVDDVDATIEVLKANDMVVFDEIDEPVGAYPFTMEQRMHRVDVNGHRLHCMCALDALAVSPMFGLETVINSKCAVTGQPISIEQHDHAIVNDEDNRDVYFGISWNSAANNCCATSLCTEMLFLKSGAIADVWRDEDPDNRELFSLTEAVDFAAGFFVPLLRNQATRRRP